MEQKNCFFTVIILIFLSRHVQNAEDRGTVAYADKNRVIFENSKKKLKCELKAQKMKVYKSIYCFKNHKRKSLSNLVMTVSKKSKKARYSSYYKSHIIYINMNLWGRLYYK